MASKSLLLSVGAGALLTVAGLCVAKKVKQYFANREKVRTIRSNLLLSARCSWLLSELGIEQSTDPSCDERLAAVSDVIQPVSKHRGRLVRQESDYQVIVYSPCISCEDLTIATDDSHGDSIDSGYETSLSDGIVDDDFIMIESAALCMYLADLYGKLVAEPQHRAEYYSWIVYSSATFDSLVKTVHNQLTKDPSQRDERILQSALSGFRAFARALDDTLSVTNYLCGNSLTAADCVVGFTLFNASTIDGGRLLGSYPAILSYLHRLQTRPAFQRTFFGSTDVDFSFDTMHSYTAFMPRICYK